MNPTAEQLFDERGSNVHEMTPLWPYWLALAFVIDFFELALRKGHFDRLIAWVRRRRVRRAVQETAVAAD